MKKLLAVLALLLVASTSHAARIGYLPFDSDLTDSYGFLGVYETGAGTPWTSPEFIAGYTDNALRSSHNASDNPNGYDDLVVQWGQWPDTGVVYAKFWLKYEAEYSADCGANGWNEKWAWNSNMELIFSDYADGHLQLTWTFTGTGNGFNSGTKAQIWFDGPTYAFGDWMLVEIYMKRSTVAGETADGEGWIKINGETIRSETNIITGSMTAIRIPGIKGTCSPASGAGWWQLDEYEAFDGLDNVADTVPSAFTFTDVTGAARSTVISSPDNVQAAGIDNQTTISISGTGCEYSKNGAAFTSLADNVTVGDNVALHTTSSANYGTAVSCILNMGGVTDTWSVATETAAVATETPKSRFGGRGGWR